MYGVDFNIEEMDKKQILEKRFDKLEKH